MPAKPEGGGGKGLSGPTTKKTLFFYLRPPLVCSNMPKTVLKSPQGEGIFRNENANFSVFHHIIFVYRAITTFKGSK